MHPLIPLSVPVISGNEWKYIKECLDTGWVSSVGSSVVKFEEKVKDYVGSEYGIAVVNGTSALHLSLIACGVCANDEVVVPTLTFIAPVNVIRYCNAYPVFMDSNKSTLCIDIQTFVDFAKNECEQRKDGFTYNENTGRRIKAIIPVHAFGHPADMDPLVEVCKELNISIIEDATESLGSTYKGRYTGTIGTIGCFSFNGNKIITTGGGGMVVTDNKEIAHRIKHLSNQAKNDPFEYEHDEIGYNYRLTNIQAAMGLAQMENLENFIQIKRENASLYQSLLSDVSEVEFPWEKPEVRSNFWFYTIRIPKDDKKALMDYLISQGIQVRPIWKLIHTLPMYKDCQSYMVSNAVEIYETAINIPCSIGLGKDDIRFVVKNIKEYFSKI